jgi:hypothetical protein
MRGFLPYVQAGTFLAAIVDAKALKWQQEEPNWSPAQPTQAAMGLYDQLSPRPTEAPDASHLFEKRAERDQTCGYINAIYGRPPTLCRILALVCVGIC